MSTPTITDVPNVLVGHVHDAEAITGCTVVLTTAGATCGVDMRGGGPSTRETDLLRPEAATVPVHAIALCGGSAFGQAATPGVMQWLYEQAIGHKVRTWRVPIVPAAVIFDLGIGRSDRWADSAMGYAACANAGPSTAEGCVGVGMGATVGKILGINAAVKSGVGTWSETLVDGTVVGALAVCNAFGDVWQEGRDILAGVRDLKHGGFANTSHLLRQERVQRFLNAPDAGNVDASNTTLAVVATNAKLDKAEATKLSQMAQDAFARMIRPIHTPFDGDTVFALSVGDKPAPHMAILGCVAADVLVKAIERSITEATTVGGIPSCHAC